MDLRPVVAASSVALAVVACGPQESSPIADTTWVGTITTEGNVTTIVNESGSVWGGTARLVEEASIGVESGADEYMFGEVQSLYATADRIAVLDRQLKGVRVYDRSGEFIATVGGPGAGPGEFVYPGLVTMDADNRVYVLDPDTRRVSQFAADGAFITSWEVPRTRCCVGILFAGPKSVAWLPIEERDRDTGERRYGVQGYGPEGATSAPRWLPEIELAELSFETPERTLANLPFAPRVAWGFTAVGGIAIGASDRYRFEIFAPDDSSVVVEHYGLAARVGADEREWNRQLVVALQSSRIPGWSWDGAEIPEDRPFFGSLIPSASGELWVRRESGSQRVQDCLQNPIEEFTGPASIRRCFRPEFTIDAFAADGRYLGEVEGLPLSGTPFIDGDMVVAAVQDEAGTIMVKRYRLVLPGEQ